MNISIINTQAKSRSAEIAAEGDLIVRDSIEIREQLLNVLDNYQNIEIHFKNIERIDITALQLLVALSKEAVKQEKLVKYTFEETEYISAILNNSGFNKFLLPDN